MYWIAFTDRKCGTSRSSANGESFAWMGIFGPLDRGNSRGESVRAELVQDSHIGIGQERRFVVSEESTLVECQFRVATTEPVHRHEVG